MIRRFFVRTFLAFIGAWLAATLVPGVQTDGLLPTFLLMGIFIGVGEVALQVLQPGAAVLLFFLPRPVRMFVLRVITVAIATLLVSGFAFTAPVFTATFFVGLLGTTLLLSLLFLLPLAS